MYFRGIMPFTKTSACFCRYSNKLENVKKAIDDYKMAQIKLKEDKLKKKQDKKIINVWYED